MSTRNLHHALAPRAIAVVGASERAGSLGAAVMRNLLAAGFAGPIYPVNPRLDRVMGRDCLQGVDDLPDGVDLAAVATPPLVAPDSVAALARRGVPVTVVLTAGVSAAGQRVMLDAARPRVMRIAGPDALGLMIPGAGLNLSAAPLFARPGRLALISQSGAIATTLIDWAAERDIGFSHVVSFGAMADVDVGDCLNLLAAEGGARAILLYLETIPSPRKFLSAARAAARIKPVIVLKAGRSPVAAAAAATHAGALLGADAVVDAALRRAGVLRVDGLAEMFAAAETVARFRPLDRARVAIVTNGGGAGILAADRLAAAGAEFATLAPATRAALDAALPPGWAGPNPLDLMSDATPERYAAALEAISADPGVDVTLTFNCPAGVSDSEAIATRVAGLTESGRIKGKPALTGWLGGAAARGSRAILRAAGLASYDTPGAAADAVRHLTEWGRAQAALLQVPDRKRDDAIRGTPPGAREAVQAILRRAAADDRGLLTAPEAAAVLAAYGVPVAPVRVAATPVEAGDVAADMLIEHRALAVKLFSPDVSHKSDVGGVVLDVVTPQGAEEAALDIAGRLARARPEARLAGFVVQPMIRRPEAQELIFGVAQDRVFGPSIVFGAGGVAVELVEDVAVALPPLDASLAAELVSRTRVARLLAGYRNRPPASADAIHGLLVTLSHMVEDLPALTSLDANPVLADAAGAIVLDARIEIDPSLVDVAPPNPRLVVRPYPGDWSRAVGLKDGAYLIRPVLPLDALLYPDFFAKLDDEDVRMRFMAPRRHFPQEMALRLTQLDYDREIAFVAIAPDGSLAGVSRLACDPDHESGEYALVVRSDLAGRGIGTILMRQLLDYARADGVQRVEGMVLADNAPMRALVARLGFTIELMPEDPGVVMSHLTL